MGSSKKAKKQIVKFATTLSVGELVGRISEVFSTFSDVRGASNATKYEVSDAAKSAFAVFFTQGPSFLGQQARMQLKHGKNNAGSLFGVHKIPSDNQIRNLLDPVPASSLHPLIADIGSELYRQGFLDDYRSVGGKLLIAIDGTDCFSSGKISCKCCTVSVNKETDAKHYRHTSVTPVLVAPGRDKVISLPPEFVTPQDGHDKQDCELFTTIRWLDVWGDFYAKWGATLLGDDLYCHQPYCERVVRKGFDFLLTCKPDSHKELYEWLADFERNGSVKIVVHQRKIGKSVFTDTYRYMNTLPLRGGADAMMVNWFDLTTTDATGATTYRNSWATSHVVGYENVAELALAGRARWKIENENNNVLKTKGYNFEHNFGHGKENLANLLATMIILSFLAHTVLESTDSAYHTIRHRMPSRSSFFELWRGLLLIMPLDNWDHAMNQLLDAVEPAGP